MFKKLMIAICVVSICAGGGENIFAQKKKNKKESVKTEAVAKDTSAAAKKPAKKGPVALDKFVKPNAKVMKGLTTVYKQEGKFYINIPDSLLGRDIRVVSRVSKSAEGIRGSFSGYAGDIINSAMLILRRERTTKSISRAECTVSAQARLCPRMWQTQTIRLSWQHSTSKPSLQTRKTM